MKGKTTQKLFLVLLCLVLQEVLLGQTQKIHTLEMNDGTLSPTISMNKDALIDMQSSKKGLLLPRVALTAARQPAPLAVHTAGMTVYNTATVSGTATVEGVTPGYYYNDGTKWVRLSPEVETEWKDGSNLIYAKQAKKAGNDMVITDDGKLGIGTAAPAANLDVNGNVRIADGTQGAGKVLMSDTEGNTSWGRPGTEYAIKGHIPVNPVETGMDPALHNGETIAYTGCYIKLPKGEWLVSFSTWLQAKGTNLTSKNLSFGSVFLSTSKTEHIAPTYVSNIKSVILNPLYAGGIALEYYGIGEIAIKLDAPKTIYLWGFISRSAWNKEPLSPTGAIISSFNGWKGEYGPYTQLYAVPIHFINH